jgi:hypothetical protein
MASQEMKRDQLMEYTWEWTRDRRRKEAFECMQENTTLFVAQHTQQRHIQHPPLQN